MPSASAVACRSYADCQVVPACALHFHNLGSSDVRARACVCVCVCVCVSNTAMLAGAMLSAVAGTYAPVPRGAGNPPWRAWGLPHALQSLSTPMMCVCVSVFDVLAGAMLSARHAAERLQNCWHGGSQTIDQLRTSMQVCMRLSLSPLSMVLEMLCSLSRPTSNAGS